MTNLDVLEKYHLYASYRRNFMVFSNSIGPNETPCNTTSHCDPCCLKMAKEKVYKIWKNLEISGEIRRNGQTAIEWSQHRFIITKVSRKFKMGFIFSHVSLQDFQSSLKKLDVVDFINRSTISPGFFWRSPDFSRF